MMIRGSDAGQETKGEAKLDGRSWWGTFEPPETGVRFWRIGPLWLWIERLAREWRVAYRSSDDLLDRTLDMRVDGEPLPRDADVTLLRFGYREPPSPLRLTPAVADRPLVVEAETPFYLPPGEELTLYISSPLWLRIDVGAPPEPLTEFPVYRPKETWFGPSTVGGESAYAARTNAHMQLEDLPIRPQRAVSSVTIRNRSAVVLPLERVMLPLPNLSLFSTGDGHLWTEPVTLEHAGDEGMATFEIDHRSAERLGSVVSGPRQVAPRGNLIRAFSKLFVQRGRIG